MKLTHENIIDYSSMFEAFKKFCQIILSVLQQHGDIPITIEFVVVKSNDFVTNQMEQIVCEFGKKAKNTLVNNYS